MENSLSKIILSNKTLVEVVEFNYPFRKEIVNKILQLAEDNSHADYDKNYINDSNTHGTLARLFFLNELKSIYICYIDGTFSYFSAIREVDNTIMFGVRLFSNITRFSSLPYHPAYVIPHQIKRARQLGYHTGFISYNVGVRTNLFNMIIRLQTSNSTNEVIAAASNTARLFTVEKNKIINNVEQHWLSIKL